MGVRAGRIKHGLYVFKLGIDRDAASRAENEAAPFSHPVDQRLTVVGDLLRRRPIGDAGAQSMPETHFTVKPLEGF